MVLIADGVPQQTQTFENYPGYLLWHLDIFPSKVNKGNAQDRLIFNGEHLSLNTDIFCIPEKGYKISVFSPCRKSILTSILLQASLSIC